MKKKSSTVTNYLFMVAYNILGIIMPLITAPYIARVLGTEGVGTYTYYFTIANYFSSIAKMGLSNYGVRHIAEVRDNETALKTVFTTIYGMQAAFSLAISLVYFVMVVFLYDGNHKIGLIFGLLVLGNILNVDWLLFGLEQFKKASTCRILVKILEVAAVFLFVKTTRDVWIYALIYCSGYAVAYLYFMWHGRRFFSLKYLHFKECIVHLKPCLILTIPVLASAIYRSMDKVMLGWICGMDETGLYESAEKIIYSLTMLISSLGNVMMPKMSALWASDRRSEVITGVEKSLIFIIFLTCAECFGILSVSTSLIPWFYGKEFSGSIILINLLAPTLIMIGWGNIIRMQYIIPAKHDNIYVRTVSLGALINLIVNAALMPILGGVGACIGTICAELSVPLCQAFSLRKELKQGNFIRKSVFFLIDGMIMLLVLKFIEHFLGTGLFTMMLQIVVGGILYLGLALIYLHRTNNMDLIRNVIPTRRKSGSLK